MSSCTPLRPAAPPIPLVRDRYPDPAERSRVTAQTTHAFLARAGRAIEAR